jgi:hypothetical protein
MVKMHNANTNMTFLWDKAKCSPTPRPALRDFFIDNLLVRIHYTIVIIR